MICASDFWIEHLWMTQGVPNRHDYTSGASGCHYSRYQVEAIMLKAI